MELKHTEYGDYVTFSEKKDFDSFAAEVAEHTSDRYTTLVFMDGDVSHVTGPWQARKQVWASFDGQFTAAQVAEHLLIAYQPPDGYMGLPYPDRARV